MKRFCTGAMSFGSISREAHESLAIAMPGSQEPSRNRLYEEAAKLASLAGEKIWDPTACGNGPRQGTPLRMIVDWDAPGIDTENIQAFITAAGVVDAFWRSVVAGVINTNAGGGSLITVPLLNLAGVPGTVAGLFPWLLWRSGLTEGWIDLRTTQWLGLVPLALGVALLADEAVRISQSGGFVGCHGIITDPDSTINDPDALVEVKLGGETIEPEDVEAGTGFYEHRFVRGEIKPAIASTSGLKSSASRHG